MDQKNDLDPRPRCVRCGELTNRALAFIAKLFNDAGFQIRLNWFPKKRVPICERCHNGTDKIPVLDTTTGTMFGWVSRDEVVMPGTEVIYI